MNNDIEIEIEERDDDCMTCLAVSALIVVAFWGSVFALIWSGAHG